MNTLGQNAFSQLLRLNKLIKKLTADNNVEALNETKILYNKVLTEVRTYIKRGTHGNNY